MLRPMLEEDVPAVHELNVETFEALARSRGLPEEPRPDPALAQIRHRHLVRTDPQGAWVQEREGEIVGCALALRREDVWGLSLLIVHPEHQSSGIGRALLARAHEYADGARGRIILSSEDPRAIRSYARLGLELHPTISAVGKPRDVHAPAGVRAGGTDDIAFTERVDRFVRGAAHGADIGAQLEMGQTLLVSDSAYCVVGGDGEIRMLAALDALGAREVLQAALARVEKATVSWITAKQNWALGVVMDAGLELIADAGCVFVDGDVGPFTPYLPSGAFL